MDNAIAEKLVAAINRLADCMASASEAAPEAINYPEASPVPAPAPAPAPIEEKKKPGRPKKEEAAPAPAAPAPAAPAPAAPAAPVITLDSLIVRLKAFVALDEAANGQKVKALNQSFGVAKLTALDSSKYAEWSDKLKELEAGLPDEDSLV